jgi:hypothetical protein
MDSRRTWALVFGFLCSYLDSGFHCLDSGFLNQKKVGFRITSQGARYNSAATVPLAVYNSLHIYAIINRGGY